MAFPYRPWSSVIRGFDASRMDNEVLLSHRTLTRNNQGEQVPTWKQYARVWAEKRDLRGDERMASQQLYAEQMTQFIMRWRSDVLVTDRLTVLDGSAVYEITMASEIPRHVGLDLLCRTLVL